MNFYHNTTAQRLHNCSYQVNYMAGYILFMGISAPLPSTSVNYQHVFDTKVDDILPDDELQLYIQCAAEHEIGKSLLRYCRRSMNSQQDGRKPKYHITPSPLTHMRANKNRADYMTFPAIDQNEASINGTIAILKQIIDMLGLNSRDVLDSVLWISGDYLRVRNIARAIYRRQEHRERIHNFSFIEPIAGLFHLQMNALKMIMHAFDGAGGNPGSLRRFAALLRRKTVGKDVKDFHGSNEFFNHVLDAHILACLMKEIKAKTLTELHQWLRQNNWPNAIAKISREYGDPYIVQTRYSAMIDSVETQMEERMKQVLDNRAALKAARVAERQSTGRNAEPLPSFDRKKEESRILKELSGGMWDVVWQNAALLVVAGLVYRDFSEACKGGYSGRVEKCIQTLMLMFQVRTHFKRSAGT
jgi:hypothetical protein